jgi:16S rRNA (adenine1518-N6/adenine1519-N6)-dimethyltransferase
VKFKKQFGQNFLRNDRFANKLVEHAAVVEGDVVIEVGPGDGRVTKAILETGAKVISVEIDYSLLPNLIKRYNEYPNWDLVHKDIMELDVPATLKEFAPEHQSYKVIGSLPYNISKQIISKFLTIAQPPLNITVIVQDEVAKDYVAAAPKSSFLSSWSHLYADVRKLESIPASQFMPVPKVDGGILRFTPKVGANTPELEKLIRLGYTNPRKTLANNLKPIYGDRLLVSLEKLTLKPTVRPAEMSQADWGKLYELLSS